jgi:hypothetical protein
MTKLVDYLVKREHQGDLITDDGTEIHLFREGDTRTANPSIVATLVKSGVLENPDGEKADEALDNAAEGDADENKSEGNAPDNKSGTRKPAAK